MRPTVLLLILLSCVRFALCQSSMDETPMATQLRTGFEGSSYSNGRTSGVASLDVLHRYSRRITLEGVVNGGQYFDDTFGGGGMFVTIKAGRSSYLSGGGLFNSHTSTTQAWLASLEAGTVLYRSSGFLKAIEGDYTQVWKGFGLKLTQTSVDTYTPQLTFYFPRNWDIMLHAGAIDVITAGMHDVTPGGGARLRIPVSRRLSFTASAGFDSEGTMSVQQVQNLSTRNFGGGVKYWLTRTLSIEAMGQATYYNANRLSGTIYGLSLTRRFQERP